MTAGYYIVQIFSFIEAAGILMLIWILLASTGPLYIFKNKNRLLRLFTAVVLVSANIVIAVSKLTKNQGFQSSAGNILGFFIDFVAVIFAAACLITILTRGRDRGMKKEKAGIVTVSARQLNIHSSIRPLPYLQMRENERVQTGTWDHDGIREFLVFIGSTLTGLTEDSDITMEIIPHGGEPNVYYVTRAHIEGRKGIMLRMLDAVSFAAGIMFVLSVLFMNYDSMILHVPLPYPEGYPSISLMAGSIAVMLFKWVGSVSGSADSKAGKTALTVFKVIIYVLLAMSLLSLPGTFIDCLRFYF